MPLSLTFLYFREVAHTGVEISKYSLLQEIAAPLAGCEHKMPGEQVPWQTEEPIQLPMEISCTSLVVQSLATYDGPFYEDGSGMEVVDVASLLLYNSSDDWIPYASVIVDTQSCRYCFRAQRIPPHCTVLIPETSAQQYTDGTITNVFGWHTVETAPGEEALVVQEQTDTTLCIRNVSERELENITVYFRKVIDGIGVGGKPHEFTVPSLSPGEAVTVKPKYYVKGYSCIVGYEVKNSGTQVD